MGRGDLYPGCIGVNPGVVDHQEANLLHAARHVAVQIARQFVDKVLNVEFTLHIIQLRRQLAL